MEEMIPIVAIVFTFGIPIVAILTHHQRKMAELIHGKQGTNDEAIRQELGRLAHENQELKRRLSGLEDAVIHTPVVRSSEEVLRG
ncbi:MAG: hypothetical protein KF812_06625 [Fimbriimonadaceae bacterium]|nr:hypothetical protein [Fimbriimonadaceae bacterium]